MTYKHDDPRIRQLELRFNNGVGALLCDCRRIIATGWDHEGKTYECKCGNPYEIVRVETDDPTVYFLGALNN